MFKTLKVKLKKSVWLKHFVWRFKACISKIFYDDKTFLRKKYKSTHGHYPNLINPTTFNEKLLWSQLNYRNDLYSKYADKFAVREFIKNTIGDEYLIKCLGVYKNFKEIDFDSLPKSFVLKATHGSGWNFICADKNDINLKECKREINYWLSTSYHDKNREWNYKYIEPRVICEEYIGDPTTGKAPLDYKFFCFNGEVKFVQLDIDRYDGHKRNVYDPEWNQLVDFEATHKQDMSKVYDKPEKWEEMLIIASKLAETFEHVRVDLYYVDNKIYFGELTFFHGGGIYESFKPESFDKQISSWFNLPQRNIDTWKAPSRYI